jgi:hypothetical protein
MAPVTKILQRTKSLVGTKNNITPPAAISSPRATVGDVLFPPEGDATIASITCFYIYPGLIIKQIASPYI